MPKVALHVPLRQQWFSQHGKLVNFVAQMNLLARRAGSGWRMERDAGGFWLVFAAVTYDFGFSTKPASKNNKLHLLALFQADFLCLAFINLHTFLFVCLFCLISFLRDVQQTFFFSFHRFMNLRYELALFSAGVFFCLESCCLWEEKPVSSCLSNAHQHLVPAGV